MNDDVLRDFASGTIESTLKYIGNFFAEIVAIQDIFLLVIVPTVGLLISATAVVDVVKMKNPRYAQKVSPGSVATRMVVGPVTILLTSFMLQVNESVFGGDRIDSKVPTAMTYSGMGSNGDPMAGVLLAITGFLVFVGWVTALRAMMAFARCGNPQQDGYALAKAGGARLVAAVFLTMFQFFMDDMFAAFTGNANSFSSKLNL